MEKFMFSMERMVQAEPGIIVGPIANFLGFILDFIFNITSNISMATALGLSIILFTVVIRLLLLPLAVKMHKNMEKMRLLKPQMELITKKYEGKKDQESTRNKNIEIQKLYSESGTNPLGGCLPALIQMPIFITLFTMFQRPYMYITQLGDVYYRLATSFMSIPYVETNGQTVQGLLYYIQQAPSIGLDKLPNNIFIDLRETSDVMRLFNVYTEQDWNTLLSIVPHTSIDYAYITSLLSDKNILEHFLTISLVAPSGFGWPGILLPILSAGSTFLTSRLMMKQQPMGGDNQAMAMQQKMMLYFMPVMMGVITITSPAGVGLYWVVSNLFHLGQHIVLNKIAEKKAKEVEVLG
jgi:YidC/Oxa1 family membrane protein insertase